MNQEEMESYFILQNYLQNGFSARGLLLIFKHLDSIRKSREFEGEKYSANTQIAKIMMYIEDLFTILIAVKDFNADYYRLLDKNLEENYENKDLGDRITLFMKILFRRLGKNAV